MEIVSLIIGSMGQVQMQGLMIQVMPITAVM